jgi:hypothetical protein
MDSFFVMGLFVFLLLVVLGVKQKVNCSAHADSASLTCASPSTNDNA